MAAQHCWSARPQPTLGRRPLARLATAACLLVACVFGNACSTPSLVEVARRRQGADTGAKHVKDDVTVPYAITDWDILNYADEIKRKLANRSNIHAGLRYGSATTEATLAALAAAAKTAGWGVTTASGLGTAASYIFGLSQIFDSKGQSQAYETAYTAIEKAEATYFLHQLGYTVSRGTDGQFHLLADPHRDAATYARHGKSIPNKDRMTIDGETLYYRVSKTLKVLDDALQQKIPNLDDLKDSMGESSAAPTATTPVKPEHPGGTTSDPGKGTADITLPPVGTGPSTAVKTGTTSIGGGTARSSTDAAGKSLLQFGWPGGKKNDQNLAQLRQWMDAHDLKDVDPSTLIYTASYADQRWAAVQAMTLLHPDPRDPTTDVLKLYVMPQGVKNEQNYAALQKWLAENISDSTSVTAFIYDPVYAAKRQAAINALGLSRHATLDRAGLALQQYCWPAKTPNQPHLDQLRAWMNENELAAIDFITFINDLQYADQRKAAVKSLHVPT